MGEIVIPKEIQNLQGYTYYVDQKGNLCRELTQKFDKKLKGGLKTK